jgi:hypothetical protein
MKAMHQVYIILMFVCLFCGTTSLQSQTTGKIILSDLNSINLLLDSLINKDFYNDSNAPIKILFIFKVDSIGEVLSAHVFRNTNLKTEKIHLIYYFIESYFSVKFIYEEYKEWDRQKYVHFHYPYSNIRDD